MKTNNILNLTGKPAGIFGISELVEPRMTNSSVVRIAEGIVKNVQVEASFYTGDSENKISIDAVFLSGELLKIPGINIYLKIAGFTVLSEREVVIKGLPVFLIEGEDPKSGRISVPAIKLEAEFDVGFYETPEATENFYSSVHAPVYYNGVLNGEKISVTIDGTMSNDEAHKSFIEEMTCCSYCGEGTIRTPGPGIVVFSCSKCGTEETVKLN